MGGFCYVLKRTARKLTVAEGMKRKGQKGNGRIKTVNVL